MRITKSIVAAFAVLALALVGCGREAPLEVSPVPTETEIEDAAEEPEPTEAIEPEETEIETDEQEDPIEVAPEGTRENPLEIGQSRKVSDESAWIVGIVESNLDAAAEIHAADEYAPRPEDGERFIVATLWVQIDGSAIERQGFNLSNDGADPRASLFVSYVAEDGTSYEDGGSSWCYTNNDFLDAVGIMYQDGAEGSGDFCIVIPEEKVDGGLWRVSNTVNDSIWFQSTAN